MVALLEQNKMLPKFPPVYSWAAAKFGTSEAKHHPYIFQLSCSTTSPASKILHLKIHCCPFIGPSEASTLVSLITMSTLYIFPKFCKVPQSCRTPLPSLQPWANHVLFCCHPLMLHISYPTSSISSSQLPTPTVPLCLQQCSWHRIGLAVGLIRSTTGSSTGHSSILPSLCNSKVTFPGAGDSQRTVSFTVNSHVWTCL